LIVRPNLTNLFLKLIRSKKYGQKISNLASAFCSLFLPIAGDWLFYLQKIQKLTPANVQFSLVENKTKILNYISGRLPSCMHELPGVRQLHEEDQPPPRRPSHSGQLINPAAAAPGTICIYRSEGQPRNSRPDISADQFNIPALMKQFLNTSSNQDSGIPAQARPLGYQPNQGSGVPAQP
jgi:hypothetical protein